jgi:acetyl-CoA carboxylase biotin carboxyl carrier protein
VEFDLNQVRELLQMLNETSISELSLKSGDFELTLRKGGVVVGSPAIATDTAAVAVTHIEQAPAVPELAPLPAANKKWIEISSPMVGTFYSSPAPDEDPFVEIGATVRKGQTICIIEAMKLMNEIESEANGQIMEILVQNGEPVEYGQALMRINPG